MTYTFRESFIDTFCQPQTLVHTSCRDLKVASRGATVSIRQVGQNATVRILDHFKYNGEWYGGRG